MGSNGVNKKKYKRQPETRNSFTSDPMRIIITIMINFYNSSFLAAAVAMDAKSVWGPVADVNGPFAAE